MPTRKELLPMLCLPIEFFHEVIQLPDVHFTLHGEGLLQALTALKLTDPDQLKEFMDKRENVVETTIAVVQRPQVGLVEGTFEIPMEDIYAS